GAKAAGESCDAANECSAVCCTCAGSSVQWLAAACIDGKCADVAGACSEPPSDAFCEEVHRKSTSQSNSNYRCVPSGGRKKIGEPCSNGEECAATCCSCASSRSWSAS